MFRSQYDGDVTTWSPEGRLFQVEYALEAEKQGSTTLCLRSKDYVISVALCRRINKLADYTRKIYRLDEHAGITFSGLAADARMLTEEMQMSCINHRFVYDEPLACSRLISDVADDFAKRCMGSFGGPRPYGVGILAFGHDDPSGVTKGAGPHIHYLNPAGLCQEYEALAIGKRKQSAKTYLETHLSEFKTASKEELIIHALKALRSSLQGDQELDGENVTIAIVGRKQKFKLLPEAEIKEYLAVFNDEEGDDMEEEKQATDAGNA